jgi:hypothetical protein
MGGDGSGHVPAHAPRPSPAVSAKLLNAVSTTAGRFSEHFRARALSANPARVCCGVQCARLSCRGTFRCGAVSLAHLEQTLCIYVKIAGMVRAVWLSRQECLPETRDLCAQCRSTNRPGLRWKVVSHFSSSRKPPSCAGGLQKFDIKFDIFGSLVTPLILEHLPGDQVADHTEVAT